MTHGPMGQVDPYINTVPNGVNIFIHPTFLILSTKQKTGIDPSLLTKH